MKFKCEYESYVQEVDAESEVEAAYAFANAINVIFTATDIFTVNGTMYRANLTEVYIPEVIF